MRLTFAIFLTAFALTGPASAQAQLRDSALIVTRIQPADLPSLAASAREVGIRVSADQAREGRVSGAWLAAGGVVGAGAGLFTGMLAGALLDGRPDPGCRDFCFGSGLVFGALLGEAAGLALGVHVVNGGKGSYALDALTSVGLLAATLYLGQDAFGGPEILIVIPAAQIVGTIITERRTSRRR
ncbi:hypothetical protein [Longimicrobium sp.]|jgi:hypothetical protein|uniref:hypothetical protein n=1 Tax=Longimicrobium sp. TaxID=2029185 RepID=UPI002ED978C5